MKPLGPLAPCFPLPVPPAGWRALCCFILFASLPGWLAAAEPSEVSSSRGWKHPQQLFLSNRGLLDQQPPRLEYSEVLYKKGDDSRWAGPGWDDRDWQKLPGYSSFPAREGVFWIRFRLRGGRADEHLPTGFLITLTAAYELYWDGQLVGQCGRPGNSRKEEVAGPLDSIHEIPLELLGEGEHLLALRMSSYRNGFPSDTVYIQCFSDTPRNLAKIMQPLFLVPVIATGAMFMLALVTVSLWLLATRRAALPWFFGLCLSLALLQGLLAIRYIVGYNYDWAYPMVLLRTFFAGVIGFSLVAFIVVHFGLPRRGIWLAILLVAYGVIPFVTENRAGTTEGLLVWSALLLALFAAGWAATIKRRKSAWWVVLGVGTAAVLALTDLSTFGLSQLFPKLLPAYLCLLTVVSVQVLAERRQAREAQLTSARLEIELLKKNIQPHFLLNTLTAISEVIVQNPASAVQLIDDLADEFRALARMSGEKQVPLGEELNLCRKHLRMLSLRMAITCSLETKEVDEHQLVPPAIFLTLIENGFTHQQVDSGATIFSLSQTEQAGRKQLAFFSPGRIRELGDRAPGGTGLRYVKARLEESFPGHWTFDQHAVDGGWETIIGLG